MRSKMYFRDTQEDGIQVMVEDVDGNKMADIVCFHKIIGKIEVFFNPISNTGKM